MLSLSLSLSICSHSASAATSLLAAVLSIVGVVAVAALWRGVGAFEELVEVEVEVQSRSNIP